MKCCFVYLPGSFGRFATLKIVFDADSNHSSNVSLSGYYKIMSFIFDEFNES